MKFLNSVFIMRSAVSASFLYFGVFLGNQKAQSIKSIEEWTHWWMRMTQESVRKLAEFGLGWCCWSSIILRTELCWVRTPFEEWGFEASRERDFYSIWAERLRARGSELWAVSYCCYWVFLVDNFFFCRHIFVWILNKDGEAWLWCASSYSSFWLVLLRGVTLLALYSFSWGSCVGTDH